MSGDYSFPDLTDVIVYPAIGASKSIIRVPAKSYTIPELTELQRRDRFLYIYGRAEYKDAFKATPRHRTLFCFYLQGVSGPDLSVSSNLQAPSQGPAIFLRFDWPACRRHNCTDDECTKQGFIK
jgi:hypothetical protein